MTQINWQYQVNNRAGGYIVTATDWNDFAGNFRAFIDQTTGSGTTDNSALPIGIDLVNDRVYISDPDSTTPEDANHADTTLSVVGTTTLAGNTQQTGTFTVGVDDTGYDVKFFGATSGKYMLWDESTDDLIVMGSVAVGAAAATMTTDDLVSIECHNTNGDTARFYAKGQGTGYTHADIRFDADGTTRGAGMYCFNEATDATWFTGSPYNDADSWVVARYAGSSFEERAAQNTNAVINIDSTGYVGFNVNSPTVRIHLAGGSASATNSGIAAAWDTHSSVRWKTDVANITGAVNTVKQLRPVTFKYKDPDTAEVSDMTEIGFIAEELRDHIPSVVRNEENNPEDKDDLHLMSDGNPYGKGVDYGRLSSLSIAALQELITRVEALESA